MRIDKVRSFLQKIDAQRPHALIINPDVHKEAHSPKTPCDELVLALLCKYGALIVLDPAVEFIRGLDRLQYSVYEDSLEQAEE